MNKKQAYISLIIGWCIVGIFIFFNLLSNFGKETRTSIGGVYYYGTVGAGAYIIPICLYTIIFFIILLNYYLDMKEEKNCA